MIKVFDLFSGGGGFRQGAEKAGLKIVGHCEIDKWANLFYTNAFNTENEVYFKDATKIDTRKLPDFELLLAGFPCQAFSIAGKKRGFEDSRGTMFFEVARILKDKKPKYFLLENVKGLLNHDGGKTFQTILGILSNLGIYSVEWALLNSKFYGVPQNRERVFIVGYPRGKGLGKIFPLTRTNAKTDCLRPICLGNVNPSGIGQNGRRIKNAGEEMFTLTGQDIHGAYIYQLPRGNNIGGRKDEGPTITKNQWEYNNLLISSANSKGYEVAENGDSINLTFPNSKTRRGRVGKQIAQTLQTSANIATFNNGYIRRLTPLECFRLQGFSDEVVRKGSQGISDAQLYKIAGNSVTVNVVYEILKKIKKLDNEVKDEQTRNTQLY